MRENLSLLMPCESLQPAVLDGALHPVSPSRKQTLLIVDDEEGPRQSIRIVFKEEWFDPDNPAAPETDPEIVG